MVAVLDPFAEGLGRHVHAGEQHVARGAPGGRAAVEHAEIGAADPGQVGRELVRQAPLPAIDAADPDARPRQDGARPQLGPRQAAGIGPEQVRPAELAILPRVEDGQFPAIADPGLQGRGIDAAHRAGGHRGLLLGCRHATTGGSAATPWRHRRARRPRPCPARRGRWRRAPGGCRCAGGIPPPRSPSPRSSRSAAGRR